MFTIGRRVAVIIGMALALVGSSALAETRVALVVGNSAYKNVAPLDNPAHDAKLMADTLRSLGFTLIGGGAQLDLDKAGFDGAVQNFGKQLQGADVGLFYYAGHGVQVRGANYLVPVGANLTKEADVDFQMLDANLVLRQMEGGGTKLNIVILDACRNNPFGGGGVRATEGGLAEMRAPEGTLISFATQPGNVAQDGAAGNSPFTKALAVTIIRPGLDIFRAFNEVGLAVASATAGAQQPWISVSPIKGDFYFAGTPAASTAAQSSEDPAAAVWAVTQNTTSQAILEDFIRQFGSTAYSTMAKARLDELKKSQVAVVTPTVASPIAPTPTFAQPPAQPSKVIVDPVLVGTFERDTVTDDYDWHFIYSIAPDGTYHLVTTQEEDGTYHAVAGAYRTIGAKTGRSRTGTYRAAGAAAIELRSATGTAIFRPTQRTAAIDPANPVMLGIWRAIIVRGGTTWTLTIQNNPDGTYHYEGRTEDNGSVVVVNQQWRATSALTSKSDMGTYRVVDARNVEFTDANGPTIWQRQ
jgi:hypothetical protein